MLIEVAHYDVQALQAQERDRHTACRAPGPMLASCHATLHTQPRLLASLCRELTLAGVAIACRARAGLVDTSLVRASLGERASLGVRPGGLVGVGGLVVGCAAGGCGRGHLLAPKQAALLLDRGCVLRPGEWHTQHTSATAFLSLSCQNTHTLDVCGVLIALAILGNRRKGTCSTEPDFWLVEMVGNPLKT